MASTFSVEHVPVVFPFRPYPQQVDYIQVLIQAFKNGANALLEAPTGFGKTLCLFSAFIAFQRQYKRAIHFITYAAANQTGGSLGAFLHQVELEFKWSMSEIADLMEFISETYVLSGFFDPEHGGSCGRLPNDFRAPKLFFSSRTHEQLKQAVAVIHKFYGDIPASYLASRENLCPNKNAKQKAEKYHISLNTMCKMMQRNSECGFDSNGVPEAVSGDLEDMMEKISAQGKCTYHALRTSISQADIVFAPYIYLLDPNLRNEQITQALQDSIIIFDEGHQLPDQAKQIYSGFFTQNDLDQAIIATRLAMQIYQQRYIQKASLQQVADMADISEYMLIAQHLDMGLSVFKQLHMNLQQLRHQPQVERQGNKFRIFSLMQVFNSIPINVIQPEVMKALEGVDYTIYSARSDAQNNRGVGKALDLEALEKAQFGRVAKVSSVLKLLQSQQALLSDFQIFEMLHMELVDDDGYVCDHEYHLACFDPYIAMDELKQQRPSSIILTSGTLSPLRHIEAQLRVPFKYQITFNHFFNLETQLKAAIILGKDKASPPLIGTFDNRTKDYFGTTSLVVSELVAQVPDVGILVFLNSHKVLQDFRGPLLNMFSRNPKNRTAVVIFEDQQDALKAFKASVEAGKKTVLVAVQRGKLSEGIDFADDLCRTVFVISIPFANTQSIILQRQIEYLNKTKSAFSGKDYYMSIAFQAVNQSIGRVIRHARDYGQVFLIDQRYHENMKYLPQWFQNIVKVRFLSQEQDQQSWFATRQTASTASAKSAASSEESDLVMDFDDPLEKLAQKPPTAKKEQITTKELMQGILAFRRLAEQEKGAAIANATQWLQRNDFWAKYEAIQKIAKPMLQAAQLAGLVKQIRQLKDCEHIVAILSTFGAEVAQDVLARI